MITKEAYWQMVRKKNRSKRDQKQIDQYQKSYKRRNITELEKLFIKTLLPNARVGISWAMGSPDGLHTFARLEGIGGQRALKGSDYDYPLGRRTRLIHYTGPDKLDLILKEGAFRAFSLSHSSDEQEFIAKASEMGCADWNLAKWRDNLFSLSFVDFTSRRESDWHWKHYGRDGRGVGIVVSIAPEHRYKWEDYFLGPIFYDGEQKTRFARIKEEIAAFEKKHVFRWDRPEDFYAKLFAFHKVSEFKPEQEVRLLAHWPHRSGTGGSGTYTGRKDLSCYLNQNYRRSYSVPIYLGTKQEDYMKCPSNPELELMIKHIGPRLKIEEVIVGPNVNAREFCEVFEYCNVLARQNIGYGIPMRMSDLGQAKATGTFG